MESILDINEMVEKACCTGLPAISITDRASLAGVAEFYEKSSRNGLRPVIGYECPVEPFIEEGNSSERSQSFFYIILLAEDYAGYLNLCRLNREFHKREKWDAGGIPLELISKYRRGLIALSGGNCGEINSLIRDNQYFSAQFLAGRLSEVFGNDNFYLEIQRSPNRAPATIEDRICFIAKAIGSGTVATVDIRYLSSNDIKYFRIFESMTGRVQRGYSEDPGGDHFLSPDEMADLFSDMPESLENTLTIANRCRVDLGLNTNRYPSIYEKTENLRHELERTAKAGLALRIKRKREKLSLSQWKIYLQRLKKEMATIKSLGLEGFFLIAADIVEYAAKNGIPVGSGRSGLCASLVANCLGLTDVDPVANSLFFENYMNSSHKRFPDIQIDISDEHRERLTGYLWRQYGIGCRVVPAGSFEYMGPRRFIEKAGNYIGLGSDDVATISEAVPERFCSVDSLVSSLESVPLPVSKKFSLDELIHLCRKLYHVPLNDQIHNTCFAVADSPLDELVPVVDDQEKIPRCQFSCQDLKKLGLARFYFIPLPELRILHSAIARVQRRNPDFGVNKIPLNDDKTFQMISKGDTEGLFLMQSAGMKILVSRLGVADIGELAAIIALFRPETLKRGLADEISFYKRPKILKYEKCKILRQILSETWGVFLYKEQVIEASTLLGGYDCEQGDRLTEVIAGYLYADMENEKKRFISSAKEHGIIDENYAFHLFERFENSGPCLYSKAHALAYAKMIYRMAYLKNHFSKEFRVAYIKG